MFCVPSELSSSPEVALTRVLIIPDKAFCVPPLPIRQPPHLPPPVHSFFPLPNCGSGPRELNLSLMANTSVSMKALLLSLDANFVGGVWAMFSTLALGIWKPFHMSKPFSVKWKGLHGWGGGVRPPVHVTPICSWFHTWFCIPELHRNPHRLRNRERLAKWLAMVSLSVTLASMACRPSSCPNISAGWNPTSSGGFPPSFIMSDSKAAAENPHKKTRTSPYPGSKVEGSQVPDKKVSWQAEWLEYKPVQYTASSVLTWSMWADPLVGDRNFSSKFNEEGGHVERRSQNGLYEVENGRHRNPAGWPVLVGRGLLGWWGPN